VHARRQPGSTFKPFVYAAAFESGIRPSAVYDDIPIQYRMPGGEVWAPQDMTPPSGKSMTLRDALVHSKNTITAQLTQEVGAQKVARLARNMGIRHSKLEAVPSLGLGTSPVSLKEMVTAYAPIANGGRYVEPMLVLRIERRGGGVLAEFGSAEPDRALSRPTALTLVDVMRGVVDEGTGAAIRTRHGIQADVAGKTGTTQDNSDGWFILMHRQLVAGAWVGFSDHTVKMGSDWGTGARTALPIVGEVFSVALKNRWLDVNAEFDIPRPRRRPAERDPVSEFIGNVFSRILRQLQ